MMSEEKSPKQSVIVILDPSFGTRLKEFVLRAPIWIVLSPVNEPVVRELWRRQSTEGHPTNITGMVFDGSKTAVDFFVEQVDAIDLHHGEQSSSSPYTSLEVIGLECGELVQTVLMEYGFTEFASTGSGFVAKRSIFKLLAD